jgi:hypothetical protein
MTATETPLLETIQKSSPSAKAAILALLIRERIEERPDGSPIQITDESGERVGTVVPAIRVMSSRQPPPQLAPEEQAELERRFQNRDKALSVEAMLSSLDLEDPVSGSGS